MDFIIWHSSKENQFKLSRQVNRDVFECDRTEYLRILYRFGPDKEADAHRIFNKLQMAAEKMR